MVKKDKDSQKGMVRHYFDNVSHDYSKYKYEQKKRSYMSVRQERMLEYFKSDIIGSNRTILDAGCGSGQLLAELSKLDHQLIGMDMSHEMLALTKKRVGAENGQNNVELIAADIECLPFKDDTYDVVSTAGVIEYLQNDNKVLKEFARVLKNNGSS